MEYRPKGFAGEFAKKYRKNHHSYQGLEHRPGHADRGLLVAHLKVAPGEKIHQLAVLPELPEVVPGKGAVRFNNSYIFIHDNNK